MKNVLIKKEIRMKMKLSALMVVTGLMVTSTQANLGVVYLAMQEPGIPKIMHPGQTFERKDKLKDNTMASDNNAVVSVAVNPKTIALHAKRPGTATITVTSKTGKIKKTHPITVAYNHLSEIPATNVVGTKLFIVASPIKSECVITSSEHKTVMVMRKRLHNAYYYVVKFKKAGKAKLQQDNEVITVNVVEQN
jgi:hypothetical protein